MSVETFMADELVIAGRAFKSRLIVGTGKYRSFQEMATPDPGADPPAALCVRRDDDHSVAEHDDALRRGSGPGPQG